MKEPDDPKVHERVETPDPVRVVGLSVHNVLLLVRLTAPAKWLSTPMVMVEVAGALIWADVTAWIVTVRESVWEPFVPITVAV